MTDISQKKETLKKMVRSLLISSPVELPVRQLMKDYHSFLGEPLDYRGLGYATPEEFFRDIDDTVIIGWKQGMMTLRAIADETTKHIENMVAKQKKPSKKKLSFFRGREPPRRYDYRDSRYSDSRPPRYNRGGVLPHPKIVPAYVRNQIIHLFKSYPEGIMFKDLDTAFVRHYGSRINFSHYGFFSWEEFFNSLKDVVKVKPLCTGDMKVLPVQTNNEFSSHYSQRNIVKEDIIVENRREPEVEKVSPNQESSRSRRPSKGRGRRRENSGNGDTSVGNYARSEGSSGSNDSEKRQNRQDRLELEIQQVLEDKPDGVWASKFPEEFKAKHGRPLDYTHHGFLSVIEFVSSASTVVHIERPTPTGDWKLYDARFERPQNDKSEDLRNCRSKNEKVTEDETKQAIKRLLNRLNKGIPMKEFPTFYKENTGMEIPVADLGYDTPEEYFLSLADSILQINYTKQGVLMIYAIDAEIPEFDPPQYKPPEPDYPVDVVGPGCHFTPVVCPTADEYSSLYVSNIINPGLFWVILRHKLNSLALETLMNHIDEFYNSSESQEYSLPESLVVPGQVCATLFPEDNNWHRGVITRINEEGFAAIYFVDYGNTAYVPKKAIKFLRTEFLKLPAQAIQARLANIIPSTGKWKVKSRNRMLELVKERPMVAFVTKVKVQVLSLCLTDTSDPDIDLHINDILVTEGFAQFQPDDEISEHVTKDQHKEVPDYCHVFGFNVRDEPRLPHAAGVNKEQDKGDSQGEITSTKCYVKWLQLTQDREIHIINLDGVAYVVSAELSSFFWEEDILGSMLKRSNIEAKKLTISSDEYPRLFQELTNYNVKSFSTEMLGERKFISLYEFNSVPTILRTFLEDEVELIEAVEDFISKFDPDSSYWKSSDSGRVQDPSVADTEEDPGDTDEGVNLSVDETQMVLQALQFKRKRILQTLMSSSGCSTEMVNDLNNCETEIMMLKQQLSEHKNTGTVPSPPNDTEFVKAAVTMETLTGSPESVKSPVIGTQSDDGTDKSAENQRVIQNIINSTTKPIATANIVTKASRSVSETCSTTVSNCTPFQQNQFGTQSPTGSFQSPTGSFPGMMGITDPNQQGYLNSMWMLQPGLLPNPRMANIPNYPFIMGQGMIPGYPGPIPINPMFNAQNPFPTNNLMHHPQGGQNQMPSVGRGQPQGILPGLLPLFQNLTVGRGRGGQ